MSVKDPNIDEVKKAINGDSTIFEHETECLRIAGKSRWLLSDRMKVEFTHKIACALNTPIVCYVDAYYAVTPDKTIEQNMRKGVEAKVKYLNSLTQTLRE